MKKVKETHILANNLKFIKQSPSWETDSCSCGLENSCYRPMEIKGSL